MLRLNSDDKLTVYFYSCNLSTTGYCQTYMCSSGQQHASTSALVMHVESNGWVWEAELPKLNTYYTFLQLQWIPGQYRHIPAYNFRIYTLYVTESTALK